MNLRKLLAILLIVLAVVVGSLLYVSGGNPFTHLDMNHATNQTGQTNTGQNKTNEHPLPGNQNPMQMPGMQNQEGQKLNVVLQPDLKAYIDQINQGISLLNEANGLITGDSFFTDPPKVSLEKVTTTPPDKTLPKDRTLPLVVLPDGTYQIIQSGQGDMEQAHRGIYKMGQGMTILNTVLERMNQDIKENNFPLYGANPQNANSFGAGYNPSLYGMYGQGVNPNPYAMYGHGYNQNISGMYGMGSNTGLLGLFSGGTLSSGIGLILIGFIILIFVAIGGYVLSIFKETKGEI